MDKAIEEFFRDNHSIKEFEISDGELTSLDLLYDDLPFSHTPYFKHFKSLKKLILRFGALKYYNDDFSPNLYHFPYQILELPRLETLILLGDSVSSKIVIPKLKKYLKNLLSLIIENTFLDDFKKGKNENFISNFPRNLCVLPKLRKLVIKVWDLPKLPMEIGNMISLEELEIKGSIRNIPLSLGRLKGLRRLDLSGNSLEKIPDFFNKLTNLEELNMSYNKIKKIPKSLLKLKNLEVLDLKGNQIENVPDFLFDLPNLQDIQVYHNPVKELPDWMECLRETLIYNAL